jgi:hypothetical protein|tara:strand:+ start:190 stop:351 length:162 start_codon:yes stop_codon:yes gene_type:complete
VKPITKNSSFALFFTSCLVFGLASLAGEVRMKFDPSQLRPQIEEGSRGRERIV